MAAELWRMGAADLADAIRSKQVKSREVVEAQVVPVGTANGLPQGVQLIGDRYREDVCLDAAEAIEQRLGVVTPIDLQ